MRGKQLQISEEIILFRKLSIERKFKKRVLVLKSNGQITSKIKTIKKINKDIDLQN